MVVGGVAANDCAMRGWTGTLLSGSVHWRTSAAALGANPSAGSAARARQGLKIGSGFLAAAASRSSHRIIRPRSRPGARRAGALGSSRWPLRARRIEAKVGRHPEIDRDPPAQVGPELLLELGDDVVARLFPLAKLALEVGASGGCLGGVDARQLLGVDRAGEDAVERVIVLGRDRVELVVVATGAGDGQAEQAPPHDVDLVIDDLVTVVQVPASDGQEAGGSQGAAIGRPGRAGRRRFARPGTGRRACPR